MTVEQMLEELKSIKGADIFVACGEMFSYPKTEWTVQLEVKTEERKTEIRIKAETLYSAVSRLYDQAAELRGKGLTEFTPSLLMAPEDYSKSNQEEFF